MTSAVRQGGLRSLLWAGLATLAALAVLIALGLWQLERKSWKENLLGAIEARSFGAPGEPVPESGWPGWQAEGDEFRRVRLTGEFMHGDEIPVHGLAELRPRQASLGFYVFTPLRQADGSIVMVNRGFVPTELRDAAKRADGQVAGPVTVIGLVRAPEARSAFVPANDPARNEWFVRSLVDMVAGRGLRRVAPFYVDADNAANPGGWPRGGQTQLSLPNNHLQYALTWFGLGGALLGVFCAFAYRRLKAVGGSDALA